MECGDRASKGLRRGFPIPVLGLASRAKHQGSPVSAELFPIQKIGINITLGA